MSEAIDNAILNTLADIRLSFDRIATVMEKRFEKDYPEKIRHEATIGQFERRPIPRPNEEESGDILPTIGPKEAKAALRESTRKKNQKPQG